MVSAKSLCRDITCESVPGSPPPFLFFVGARGEPGNEAITIYLYICVYFVVHTYSYGVIVQYVYYT